MIEKGNPAQIGKLIGKYVIIGLTYTDAEDQIIDSIQLHGRINRINEAEGVVVRRDDKDEEYMLPYDLSAFEEAMPGEYRFSKTGEVITDPDYVSTWMIRKP